MDDPLTPETQQRIRALCGEIAVAHDVDPELREELRGHVEDKILAYLAGEEAVSEADAVILAREHFGDRASLKAMLAEVHRGESAESLWRRIAAGVIVMLVLFQGLVLLQGVSEWASEHTPLKSIATPGLALALRLLAAGLLPVAILHVLTRWKAVLRQGGRTWFTRWQMRSLGACALGTCAAFPLVAVSAVLLKGPDAGLPLADPDWNPQLLSALKAALVFALLVLYPAIWIWWCDERPRRPHAMRQAVTVWSLIMVYSAFAAQLFAFVSLDNARLDHAPVLLELSQGNLILVPLFGRMSFVQAGGAAGLAFLYGVSTALLGWLAYTVARATHRRLTLPKTAP